MAAGRKKCGRKDTAHGQQVIYPCSNANPVEENK